VYLWPPATQATVIVRYLCTYIINKGLGFTHTKGGYTVMDGIGVGGVGGLLHYVCSYTSAMLLTH